MMARPPNCICVPSHRYGTRFQPRMLLCVSDLKPTSARNGATSSGMASMIATSDAGTLSSRIITRLSVPTNNVCTMPTDS